MNELQSDDFPTSSGIYKITCTVTGKIYVGSALNLRRRRTRHYYDLRQNVHRNALLQRAWNKYGEQHFVFEALELVLIPELLTTREQFWFDKLHPFGNNGFNLAPIAGSQLGAKRSPETRERIRAAKLGKPKIGTKHTPETRKKISAAQIGKKLSPEHREKVRLAQLGRKHSEETKRKRSERLRGKTRSPETIEKWRIGNLGKKNSAETRARMSEAAKKRPPASAETREKIRIAGLGRPMSAKSRAMFAENNSKRMKTLIVTAPDGTEHTVHGIKQFCREHNLNHSNLIGVAKGRLMHYKGWKARYLETSID